MEHLEEFVDLLSKEFSLSKPQLTEILVKHVANFNLKKPVVLLIDTFSQLLISEMVVAQDTTVEDLKNVWYVKHPPDEIPPIQELKKYKKDKLKELCRFHNYPISGTKAVLIERLSGEATTGDKEKPAVKKSKKKKNTVPYYERYQTVIHVKRNEFGNYEDDTTHLVFDPLEGVVIGVQEDDMVRPLKPADLDVCKEKHYPYRLPLNLEQE